MPWAAVAHPGGGTAFALYRSALSSKGRFSEEVIVGRQAIAFHGRIDRADDATGGKLDPDMALEIGSQAPLDEAGSEAPALWRLNRCPAFLFPTQVEARRLNGFVQRPGDVDPS